MSFIDSIINNFASFNFGILFILTMFLGGYLTVILFRFLKSSPFFKTSKKQVIEYSIFVFGGIIFASLFLMAISQIFIKDLNQNLSIDGIVIGFIGIAISLLALSQSGNSDQSILETEIPPPDKYQPITQFRPLIICLIIAVCMVFVGYAFGVNDGHNDLENKYLTNLNEFFEISYGNITHNEGNIIINGMVSNATLQKSDNEKLSSLAASITNNFTNPWWDNGTSFWKNCYGGQIPYNHEYFGDSLSYGYDKSGRLRAQTGTKFYLDPYWIASQKTGACLELAVLFNESANRLGYPTRIVWNPSSDHAWNEVIINGSWFYADVDCYHTKGLDKWIGARNEYTDNCMCFPPTSSIYTFPSRTPSDDLTVYYYKNSSCNFFNILL